MPTNYNQTMPTPDVPDVASGYMPDTTRDASLIKMAGDALGGLFQQKEAATGEEQLGQFSGELADIENQAIEYNRQKADILRRMHAAEGTVLEEVDSELRTLEAGRRQGAIDPTLARIKTNNLIKYYSVNYPMLAKSVRSMANESMDNLREIANEVFGDDPVNKAVADVHKRAVETKRTPKEVVDADNVALQRQSEVARLEVLKKTGELTDNNLVNSVRNMSLMEANRTLGSIQATWRERLLRGDVLTEADATRELGQYKDSLMREYYTTLAEKGMFLTSAQMNDALAPAFASIDNVDKVLKSTGTIEQKLALLKNQSEFQAENQQLDVFGALSSLGGIWKHIKPDTAIDVITAASWIAQSPIDINNASWDEAARGAAINGDLAFGLGVRLLRSPEGTKLMAEYLGAYISGAPIEEGQLDTASHQVTVRNADKTVAKLTDPLQRQEIAGNVLPRLDWNDIRNNPNLIREFASNPQFTQVSMEKAAKWSSEALINKGIDASQIVVDHRNIASPITVKGEVYGNDPRSGFVNRKPTLQEMAQMPLGVQLSQAYLDILNSFGAAGVDLWLSQLNINPAEPNHGANTKSAPMSNTSDSKKKVTLEAPAAKVLEYNKGRDLPEPALMALMEQESSLGKNLRNPESTARGPMQIIKGTFEGVNAQFFGGSLDWNNDDHVIQASIAHFHDLYNRHGGNLNIVFQRWYGHKDPSKNRQFASSVLSKMAKYSG